MSFFLVLIGPSPSPPVEHFFELFLCMNALRLRADECRLREYGVPLCELSEEKDIVCRSIFCRLGNCIVSSIAYPADSWYYQKVYFPAFVRELSASLEEPLSSFSFEFWCRVCLRNYPNFYNVCISWPASIR